MAIVVKHMASSRARAASGIVVMPTMPNPACWCMSDSAREENRGPLMTTSVPSGTTCELGEPGRVDRDLASVGAVGVGEPDVDDRALGLVDRVRPPPRAVDDLVGHDDGARARARA